MQWASLIVNNLFSIIRHFNFACEIFLSTHILTSDLLLLRDQIAYIRTLAREKRASDTAGVIEYLEWRGIKRKLEKTKYSFTSSLKAREMDDFFELLHTVHILYIKLGI